MSAKERPDERDRESTSPFVAPSARATLGLPATSDTAEEGDVLTEEDERILDQVWARAAVRARRQPSAANFNGRVTAVPGIPV
jgi:hypothetical protein